MAGCSHLPRFSDRESSPEDTAVILPETEQEASAANLPSSNTIEPEVAGETLKPTSTSGDVSDANTVVASPEPAPAPEIDLLTRIRQGYDLPSFDSKYIAQYERWNSQHPTYLKNLFERAEPILYYIVEELDKRQLPLDLALLPAVESAFKPEAYSRSSAAGLWQFIPLTARHFGLRQDWWYDGRRDSIAATKAALDYLEELNALFDGDWLLTLAAYNAGQGTVGKAIRYNQRKGRGTAYQDLDLRKETRRYVPKLYALRNIIQWPERYGVTLPTIPNKPHFEIVDLPGQTDLQRFAMESGIALPTLKHLNAGHRRWATSPDGPHRLLVPLTHLSQAKATIERLAKEPTIEYQNHRIRRGETLSQISNRYGVPVSAIQQTNGLRNSRIRAGKNLLIPVAARANASGSQVVVASAGGAQNASKIVHRVVAGETLWSIARRYQVKVKQLLNWNQLSANQILSLNQALTVFVN